MGYGYPAAVAAKSVHPDRDVICIAGDGDYLNALDQHLWEAASGKVSAAEAMKRTAQDWEKITQRRGREKQLPWLRQFETGFAASEPAAK